MFCNTRLRRPSGTRFLEPTGRVPNPGRLPAVPGLLDRPETPPRVGEKGGLLSSPETTCRRFPEDLILPSLLAPKCLAVGTVEIQFVK